MELKIVTEEFTRMQANRSKRIVSHPPWILNFSILKFLKERAPDLPKKCNKWRLMSNTGGADPNEIS